MSKSSPPAASAISRSLVIACALSTMIGMCRVALSAFNCRVASQPSSTGSPRSIRMRSGSSVARHRHRLRPSTATTTRYPRRSSRRESASRLARCPRPPGLWHLEVLTIHAVIKLRSTAGLHAGAASSGRRTVKHDPSPGWLSTDTFRSSARRSATRGPAPARCHRISASSSRRLG